MRLRLGLDCSGRGGCVRSGLLSGICAIFAEAESRESEDFTGDYFGSEANTVFVVPIPHSGSHIRGLNMALTRVAGIPATGIHAIICVDAPSPQFQGPTKQVLAMEGLDAAIRDELVAYLLKSISR